MEINQKYSNFSGFIDGYKAGNFSTFLSQFKNKKAEIIKNIQNLINEIEESPENMKLIKKLESLGKNLYTMPENYESLATTIVTLADVIDIYKGISQSASEKSRKNLKKLLHSCIELANSSEDPKIMDMAINLGEKILESEPD